MSYEEQIADRLRNCDFDTHRLDDIQLAEIYRLARGAHIELWRPGVVWPSGTGADRTGGGLSRLDVTRP